MKIPLLIASASFLSMQLVQAADICVDAWAHSPTDAICTDEVGADYWGWTNGRIGTDTCAQCDSCPACPTLAPVPTKAPTTTPVPLPVKCVGFSGSWSGDPHFKTFDGLKFDCQGEGEFHVLKSLNSNMEIQGRFVKFRDNKRPTVTKSVAWRMDDSSISNEPIIQVTTPNVPVDGSCMPHVHIDKVLTDVTGQHFVDDDLTIQVALEQRFNKKFQGFVFYYHTSGVQVTILAKKSSANGCVLSAKFCLPETWDRSHEQFVGLLGTPDGDKTNDWMTKAGAPVTVPTNKKDLKFRQSYEWCVENFCVKQQADSMFAYEGSESYDGFNQCHQEADEETEKCVDTGGDETTGDLTSICGTEDFECLVDGCVGGAEEAKNFLETVIVLEKDKDCGKELLFENFDGAGDEDEWGELQEGNLDSKILYLSRNNLSFAKKISVPAGADIVKIEFLFYEIGFWEGNQKTSYSERTFMTIGGTTVDLSGGSSNGFDKKDFNGNPDEIFAGVKEGIVWNRRAITSPDQNFGFWWIANNNPDFDPSNPRDQLHKVELTVPQTFLDSGMLEIEFAVDIRGGYNDERAGIDDLRITAYGSSCDIPGLNGIYYQDGCGEQILFQDFEDNDANEWGSIGTKDGVSFLSLGNEDKVSISDVSFPSAIDIVALEFYMYDTQDWVTYCDDVNNDCSGNQLSVEIGGAVVSIDTFEKADAASPSGDTQGVQWYRSKLAEGVVKIDVHVPVVKFTGSNIAFEIALRVGATDLKLGIDDVRVVTYSNSCQTSPARRRLFDRVTTPARSRFLPSVTSDECTCLCPPLNGVQPSATASPATAKVLDLYRRSSGSSCNPEGSPIGAVTISMDDDGKVSVVYDIFSPEKYDITETAVYVGEERLPGLDIATILTPSDFPNTGTSGAYTSMDPLVCDFYVAAYAKVCGAFATPQPTPASPTAAPTKAPTETKTPAPSPAGGGANGDPHVKTWDGESFDFHGGCDLVLVKNTGFDNGLGLDIHLRTKIRTWWSYIDTAVLRIGNHTLEIKGGINSASFWIDGVPGEVTENSGWEEVGSMSGYKIEFWNVSKRQKNFRLMLGNGDTISMQTFNDFVRVDVKAKSYNFDGSIGLMGKFPSGNKLSRDGHLLSNTDIFGKEWQVLDSEPMLFHMSEAPQHPSACMMPTAASEDTKRRLGESKISQEDAEVACSRVSIGERENCVFDVLATNSLDMAGSY